MSTAEQSNTSILYGREFILKMFRRLQSGENPDVEIGRFLTEVAHFQRIAPFLGEISLLSQEGTKTTLAMLQGLVANEGDGWAWFLQELEKYYGTVASMSSPTVAHRASFLGSGEPDFEVIEKARASIEAAALLGQRTAEMHLALATETTEKAFASEEFTEADLANDASRIESQVNLTLRALREKLATLDDAIADDVVLLLSRRNDVLARARSITALPSAGQKIRIHGDYHLGQTLRVQEVVHGQGSDEGDFVLLDFEGEPARPLEERIRKQSPLKDVAGMMRSFSYAAYAGLEHHKMGRTKETEKVDEERLDAWARHWEHQASSSFLRAYRRTIATNPNLLATPEACEALLHAYLLEKALYELLYELNNRPGWLPVPLAGILSL